MFESTPQINRSPRRQRSSLRLALTCLLAAGALLVLAPSAFAAGSYGWPVKPFDREHAVRGNFGDPRTVFHAPPTQAGMLTGGGSFQFHFGIDISAPDGTKVYPVVSGTVSRVASDWLAVATGDGRTFQYWHVRSSVALGARVVAEQTELGTIVKGAKHVHFTELVGGEPVNPLAPGHLTPYSDRTPPRVQSISLRTPVQTLEQMPNFVRGSVDMIVEAYDTPERAVPGIWNGMPVAPARIAWRIQDMRGVVARRDVAVDFLSGIPANTAFWSFYARGSYQNMSVFGKHYSYRQPGRYLFRLTRSQFDTTTVPDGVYDLVVTVSDIRGNSSSQSLRLTIHNRPGWVGS